MVELVVSDLDCRRPIWAGGKGRTEADMDLFFVTLGAKQTARIQLAAMDMRLGVMPSFSRLSVSNDNPFSEALFRTVKSCPLYPTKSFASLEDAQAWVATCLQWYNDEH